jgi:hypothetical protein
MDAQVIVVVVLFEIWKPVRQKKRGLAEERSVAKTTHTLPTASRQTSVWPPAVPVGSRKIVLTSWNRVLNEKLTVAHQVRISAFYGTRRSLHCTQEPTNGPRDTPSPSAASLEDPPCRPPSNVISVYSQLPPYMAQESRFGSRQGQEMFFFHRPAL